MLKRNRIPRSYDYDVFFFVFGILAGAMMMVA